MNDDLKTNVSDMNVWIRLVFMLLFAAIYFVARMVLVAVIVLQFLWVLFTADKNQPLLSFGAQLSTYMYQIYRYLTFNTEQRPFPLADWPSDDSLIDDAEEDKEEETIPVDADVTDADTGKAEADVKPEGKDKS